MDAVNLNSSLHASQQVLLINRAIDIRSKEVNEAVLQYVAFSINV